MLILKRRPSESIYIYPHEVVNPNTTISELFAEGPIKIEYIALHTAEQVTIGILAPLSLRIMRHELEAGAES